MAGTHLLHLDSSARGGTSLSRRLGRELVKAWSARDREMVLTYRDLDAEPLPFVNDTWVSAAFSPVGQLDEDLALALDRSNELIAELYAADVLVIGAPMYNFGIPAALKAWIDQVVRLGVTFGYEGPVPVGLVKGKRAIVLATAGGDADYYASVGLDFRTSYLRAILGFIGITEIDVVTVNNTAQGTDLAKPLAEIDALLGKHLAVTTQPA
jgi:FMN-dependent NADH-azoreductase